MAEVRALVDDSIEDLRFKVGSAVEYKRKLDLCIDGGLASVLIDTVELDRGDGTSVVRFVMPNEFQLELLEIPENSTEPAVVTIYTA